MGVTNKYGLPRAVPNSVKQEVRQRCGFGCVICGLGFYDYEHFAPDFAEATEHSPAGMTLLCSQCNQKRARGRLSAQTVAAANANPKCLQQGFASELFDFGAEPIEVKFAGISFYDCRYLVVVNGIPILAVAPPLEPNQPVRLSGQFADRHGKITLTVENNIWKASSGSWDVECVGPRITVRRGRGDIALVIRMEPPHRLVIERLDMYFKGIHFRGSEQLLEVSMNGRGWQKFWGCNVSHCPVGASFSNGPDAANDPLFEDWPY